MITESLISIFQKQGRVVYIIIEIFNWIFAMELLVAFDSFAHFNIKVIECLFKLQGQIHDLHNIYKYFFYFAAV